MAQFKKAVRPSPLPKTRPSFAPKEAVMYTEGFGVAVVIGIIALLLPALWIGWWLVADLGENVSGASRQASTGRFRPVA